MLQKTPVLYSCLFLGSLPLFKTLESITKIRLIISFFAVVTLFLKILKKNFTAILKHFFKDVYY
jgi:hypothetical protein